MNTDNTRSGIDKAPNKGNKGASSAHMAAIREKSNTVRKKRMEERQSFFLDNLRKCHGIVAHAVRACDGTINYRSIRRWRDEDEAFSKAYDEAILAGVSRIESVAYELATGTYSSDMQPDPSLIKFILTHKHGDYSKDQTIKVEASVTAMRQQESVDDLKRLLQEQAMIAGSVAPASLPMGGGLTDATDSTGPPEVPTQSTEKQDDRPPSS